MGTEVQLGNIKQVVTDRIKAQFAELIPEDAWKSIIDSAVAQFMRDDLPKLIIAELLVHAKAELGRTQWDSTTGRQIASEAVAKACQENASVLMSAAISQIVQNIVDAARYRN